MLKLLNLGCGSRFCDNPSWVNIDFNSKYKQVMSYNLLKGIPFSDGTFDVVYNSHLLEHFSKSDALRLIRECSRVLKPGGIIRIVVPDLENICKTYMEILEKVMSGDTHWENKYNWIMLEMYDQVVRREPGGEMFHYLKQSNVPDKDFIIGRMGNVARNIMETKSLKEPAWKRFLRSILHIKTKGENHQWMYDRYSLRRILKEAGFKDITQCVAQKSRIPGWDSYLLDADKHGFAHIPVSLYMEGVKQI